MNLVGTFICLMWGRPRKVGFPPKKDKYDTPPNGLIFVADLIDVLTI
jgi:hypothetical protein